MDTDSLLIAIIERITKLELAEQELLRRVILLENKPSKTKAKIAGFDQNIIDMVNGLMSVWPKTRADGAPIHNDKVDACANVTRALKISDATLDELQLSCQRWLNTKPAYANAIQFYFGVGKGDVTPRWQIELAALRSSKGEE